MVADEILDRAEVDDLLDDLVEKSMLTVESGPFGMRFRLLETIGQYAAERLQEADSTDRMAERHAQWCLRRVTDIHRLLVGPSRDRRCRPPRPALAQPPGRIHLGLRTG